MDNQKRLEDRAQLVAHKVMEELSLWEHPASDTVWNALRYMYLTAYQDKEFGTPGQPAGPNRGDCPDSA